MTGRWSAKTVVVLVSLAVGCSSSTPTGDACRTNADCAAGRACISDRCVMLCAADRDCAAGEICRENLCLTGVRAGLPRIDQLDGDSAAVCPTANNSHCIATAMVVSGEHLDGSSFMLTAASGGGTFPLAVRPPASDTRAIVELGGVPAGDYLLTVANGAGSVDQAVTLLQGEQGPEGPPGSDADLTGDEILGRLNTSATGTLNANRIGAHTHHVDTLTSEAIEAGELALMFGAVGVGLNNPNGRFQVGAGYTYVRQTDSGGTPSCACDVNPAAFDCGGADFSTTAFQGTDCYDVGTGATHHYLTTDQPALTVTDDGVGVGVREPARTLDVLGRTRFQGEVQAACLSRLLRYEATCLALAGASYSMVAAVSPASSNATGSNGNAICASYVGNNNQTSWTCLYVPFVYEYGSSFGDDVRPTWNSCAVNHGGSHSAYQWFDKEECTGVLMACCVK